MTDRIPCKTDECPGTILPSTAERTGGLCMRCVNRIDQEEWKRYVEANRVDIDRFTGVTDVVEIVRRIHEPSDGDPLRNLVPYELSTADVYRSLEQDDADRLVRVAEVDDDLLESIARHLSSFSKVDLSKCQHALLNRGDPYPAHVFRGASELVVERLFVLLKQAVSREDTTLLSHTLSALVWARSRRVVERVVAWSKRSPAWATLLHLAPHRYVAEAGYEIEHGQVRDLTVRPAYQLVLAKEGQPHDVVLFEPAPGDVRCPRCSGKIVSLFRLDGASWPGGLAGAVPASVPTCLACACFGVHYVRFHATGWSWVPDVEIYPMPHPVDVDFEPRRAVLRERNEWEAADYGTSDTLSQIGGVPAWINDAVYPSCPHCRRSMLLVAQIQPDQFADFTLGIFYAYHCPACAIVGVGYDQ